LSGTFWQTVSTLNDHMGNVGFWVVGAFVLFWLLSLLNYRWRGAVGVAASLATAGALSGHDVTVLLPAIYLMGNPVQNVGRCLGTAEVNA
ncbi:hypothetical protein ONQ97_25190, partial [Salmonella enterica subsp. enterica serovar Virginia]|nr:hypothetical protein [Salmonella enterica subsp. enterica serovar Virginia]